MHNMRQYKDNKNEKEKKIKTNHTLMILILSNKSITVMVRKNTKIPVLQNSPTIVLIKILECFVKMFITFKFVPMHCSRNEFKIVN